MIGLSWTPFAVQFSGFPCLCTVSCLCLALAIDNNKRSVINSAGKWECGDDALRAQGGLLAPAKDARSHCRIKYGLIWRMKPPVKTIWAWTWVMTINKLPTSPDRNLAAEWLRRSLPDSPDFSNKLISIHQGYWSKHPPTLTDSSPATAKAFTQGTHLRPIKNALSPSLRSNRW